MLGNVDSRLVSSRLFLSHLTLDLFTDSGEPGTEDLNTEVVTPLADHQEMEAFVPEESSREARPSWVACHELKPFFSL